MLYHKTFELGPDRDWVVFVHGAGGSSSIWFKQLRAYREHFNVLLLDLRGHGQSNQLQQVVKGHYSFRAVTEDILRLLDHLRIPRAHFVGISLGTILIRHLAELCPERDWVVFVHGAGGSSSIWFKQLRAYREHFNVLLLDLRGHGQSNQLQQVVKGHYSFRAVTEDILRLLDHLRIPRAHFVGISLGTILIRHLAELCPERVKSMVLGGAILRLDIRS